MSAAVLVPGDPNDGGWSEAGTRAAASLGQVGDWRVKVKAQLQPSDVLPVTTEFVDEGLDLVIGHGCEFVDAFLALAPVHPDTYFFAMDTVEEGQSWPENYASIRQRQDQAVYLCGRLAAHMSRSGRVGFVGGLKVPTQMANSRAFERGAKSLDPSIDVMSQYAYTFEDPQLGRQIASDMIAQGADFLMHTASETGNGVAEVCIERGIITIGFILDQRKLAPAVILTSLLVDVAGIYRRKAEEISLGKFKPGVWTVGLAEGMIGLAPFADAVPEQVAVDIEETRRAIMAGELQI